MPEHELLAGWFGVLVFAVLIGVIIAWVVLPFTIYNGISRMSKTLERIEKLLGGGRR